jgi:ribosomal protein L11 methyltransferase
MFSQILIKASPRISRACRRGGCLILSGILRGQEEEVVDAFTRRGFRLEKAVRRGKWVAARMGKTGSS